MSNQQKNLLKLMVIATVILLFQLLFISSSFAKPVITDLGGSNVTATAINDNGQVVGSSSFTGNKATHAFMWENGKMTDLGTLGGYYSNATAINNKGQVVGNSDGHAFIWENGRMVDIGTLGGSSSDAKAINEKGQVVGSSSLPDNTASHAFIWQNGKMTDIGTLGGGKSYPLAINNNGQVIGVSYLKSDTSNSSSHAFIWENGKMTDLGTMDGNSLNTISINDKGQVLYISFSSDGTECMYMWENGIAKQIGTFDKYILNPIISRNNQVIGYSNFDSMEHAVLWENGKMIDLGAPRINANSTDIPVPSENGFSYANAINGKSQITGSYVYWYNDEEPATHAFIWQNGKFIDLGTLGGLNTTATALNNNGQVIGLSNLADNQTQHAFIWYDDGTPVISISPYSTKSTNKDITVTASVYDGTLNEDSHIFTENGSFTFTATNGNGETSSKTVTITNIDKTPPVITLNGSSVEYVPCNSNYVDKGAQAYDNMDGDITSLIKVSGSVNTLCPGTYSVTYSVYDKTGNAAIPVTRTLIVIANNAISFGFDLSAPEDIKITFDGDSNLIAIKNGPTALKDSDYSISGNTVIIKKSYLTYFFTKYNLSSQKLYLTFDFDTGNDPVVTIGRIFTSNTIAAPNTVFDPSNPQDITVSIKGNKLNAIKNGPTALTNWDYSISGDTVTIKKSYLMYFFTKYYSPSQKLNLTFDFSLANDPVLTITRKQ